ncbi:MAG: helix-turn-helix domain-containing protein [Pseudomonadota bacterium]
MRVQHVGYRIRGVYRIAALGHLWETTPNDAQRRLKMLRFWERHGLTATLDAFGVSRRTLYRWKAALKQAGGNPAALAAKPCAPQRRRTPTPEPRLIADIRHLRTRYPHLGKAKLHTRLAPWCKAQGIALPSASTIGRLIARAPDKMRHTPVRLDAKGRPKPARRPAKPRKPKGVRTAPLECLATDASERIRDGLKRYLVTCIDPASCLAAAKAVRSPDQPAHPGRAFRHTQPAAQAAADRALRQRQRVRGGLCPNPGTPRHPALVHLPQDPQDERPLRTLQPHDPGVLRR